MNKPKLVASNLALHSTPETHTLGNALKGPVISTPRVIKLAHNKAKKAADRRIHAWTKYNQQVQLKRASEALAEVQIDSLSRDNVMFYCDLDTVVLLLGNSLCTTPQHSCLVDLQLPIASRGKTKKLNLSCKITSSRRLSRDRFQLVMRFIELKPNQLSILDAYFNEQNSH